MAASRTESKVVTPFMPSLFHFASVKIAVQLFHEFGVELLEDACTEIHHGNLTASEEGEEKDQRAKRNLLYVPAHLRQSVMEAVRGCERWSRYISRIIECKGAERNLQFRSDGSLDTLKTFQNIVQNENFEIEDRFCYACIYCLADSVEALWAEIVASGDTEWYVTRNEGIVSFWVEWLGGQPRVSWRQSLRTWLPQRLSLDLDNPSALVPACCAFFPLLKPEEKQACLGLSDASSLDDLQFCLNTCTKDEEKQIIQGKEYTVLTLCLMWPLQTLFLDIAEKLMQLNSIHKCCFQTLLSDILNLKDKCKDFNYAELFEGFLNKSPPHLKESVSESPELSERIDSYFDEKARKRKSVQNEQSQKFSKRDSI